MRALALGVSALAGCAAAAPSTSTVASTSTTTITSPITSASTSTITIAGGPFRELPPVRSHVIAKAKTAPIGFAGSSGATIAPDGKTFFVDSDSSGKPGGFIVSEAHARGVFFGTSEVHDARFSSDGKRLVVYNDELDVATVLGVPDGAVERDVRHAKVARFDAQGALVTWNGCQLARDDVPFGPKTCGGADASDDGRTWMIVEPEPHGRPLARRDYDKLTWIDGRTGASRVVFSKGDRARGLGELRLSPMGDFVCFDAPRLQCVALRGDHAEPVDDLPPIDAYSLSWADEGARFIAAPFRFDDLVVVDLIARTTRHIALAEPFRYAGFLPGGKRIYAYQMGAWIIDIDTGDTVEAFPKTVEVGGFVPVAQRDDRFMMGNEAGASRGYLWVDIPKRAERTASP